MNAQLLVVGVSMGIIYGSVATGMVLIFQSVDVMNFAQGEFLMFGGYFCYAFSKILDLPIVLSLVLVSLSIGAVGVLSVRTSYQPLRSTQARVIIVNTMRASIVFKEGARLIWGSIPVTMDRMIQGTAHLSQATIQWQNVAIIVISVIMVALTYTLLEKTFVDNIMQATAQNQYMVSLTGTPVIVSVGLTFALSTMIIEIGGGLLASIFFLNNIMGTTAGAKAFTAVVIGDFGSVPGAVSGGSIVGLVEAFGGAYISSTYQLVLVYMVLIAVLML